MTGKKYLTLPTVLAASALTVGSGSVARAAEPTADELMQQIEQLQAKVQQLEQKQQEQQQPQARDADATIEKVLADAERRSQLLQVEGFTAGYDNGFWLRSADGTFSLNPYFQLQFRHVTTFVESSAVFDADGDIIGFDDDDEDIESGFEVRRMKFGFKGNAFSEDLTYNFRWETDEDGGGVTLEEANVLHWFSDDWAYRAGQFKDNWTHEETTSSSRQLAVDRSLMNELIAGGATDYVQGVALLWAPQDSAWRAEAAIHDGFDTDNTNFLDGMGGGFGVAPDWGVSGRVEYLVMGGWRAYDDFSARNNEENLLVVGAGGDFSQGGDDEVFFHTVDVQWENAGGLGIYAAYVGQHLEDNDLGDDDVYNWGALVQAGYMINEKLEVFGRYDYTKFDLDTITGGDDFSEVVVGINYYLHGHAAKFTLDAGWLFDGAPTDVTGIGVLASDDDEFFVRGQFQLLL